MSNNLWKNPTITKKEKEKEDMLNQMMNMTIHGPCQNTIFFGREGYPLKQSQTTSCQT
jgi:hypothetical protein